MPAVPARRRGWSAMCSAPALPAAPRRLLPRPVEMDRSLHVLKTVQCPPHPGQRHSGSVLGSSVLSSRTTFPASFAAKWSHMTQLQPLHTSRHIWCFSGEHLKGRDRTLSPLVFLGCGRTGAPVAMTESVGKAHPRNTGAVRWEEPKP